MSTGSAGVPVHRRRRRGPLQPLQLGRQREPQAVAGDARPVRDRRPQRQVRPPQAAGERPNAKTVLSD